MTWSPAFEHTVITVDDSKAMCFCPVMRLRPESQPTDQLVKANAFRRLL
jgi:hypothetical protein